MTTTSSFPFLDTLPKPPSRKCMDILSEVRRMPNEDSVALLDLLFMRLIPECMFGAPVTENALVMMDFIDILRLSHYNQLVVLSFLDTQETQRSQGVYEVEKVLKRRKVKGKRMMLVKWAGYEEPTWEPEKNMIK